MGTPIHIHRRPGVVTFIGVVIYIQALVDAVLAVAAFLQRNNADLQEVTGQSADELVVVAAVIGIVSLLLLVVANGVLSGARWARSMVAVVEGLRLAVAVYWMVTHTGGGFQWNAILTAGIALWVLWALFGNPESGAFFERDRYES